MASPNTEGYNQTMNPDVHLLRKTNRILKIMEKYESHYEMLVIESLLITAKAAFLDVCIREAHDNRYDSGEKMNARSLLESTIELFEKLYKQITKNQGT